MTLNIMYHQQFQLATFISIYYVNNIFPEYTYDYSDIIINSDILYIYISFLKNKKESDRSNAFVLLN